MGPCVGLCWPSSGCTGVRETQTPSDVNYSLLPDLHNNPERWRSGVSHILQVTSLRFRDIK